MRAYRLKKVQLLTIALIFIKLIHYLYLYLYIFIKENLLIPDRGCQLTPPKLEGLGK